MTTSGAVALTTGVTLPYLEHGDRDGVPVVLLHGFAGSAHAFAPVLEHMPASIRALAVTQRGHGDATKPSDGYAVTDFAADLVAFLDALELPTTVIVGHSAGSGIAMRFAIDHPDRTRGLVMLGAPPSTGGSEASRAFWDEKLASLTDPVEDALVRGMVEQMLVEPVDAGLIEAAIVEGRKVPAFVWRAAFESRWRGDGEYGEQLEAISAPTLVVWGDRDARYPRDQTDTLVARIPRATLLVYSGAGHLLYLEEPERLAADVSRFVASLIGLVPMR